jgi:hypothetical protein
MKTVYVVTQKNDDDGFTGCSGVFTDKSRAVDVMDRSNAQNDGYVYAVDSCNLDPTDEDLAL